MDQVLHVVSKKPTYDITDLEIVGKYDHCVFVKSTNVYQCDHVSGTIENRSKVGRLKDDHHKYIVNVIAAVMDAGFCGHVEFKFQLTNEGWDQLLNNDPGLIKFLNSACQMHLVFAKENYYDGTNQTELKPDVIFSYL